MCEGAECHQGAEQVDGGRHELSSLTLELVDTESKWTCVTSGGQEADELMR